jgi:hypothetical protein
MLNYVGEGNAFAVVVTDPAVPAAGDAVRFGFLTGVAQDDEGAGGVAAANQTVVKFGGGIYNIPVTDTGGGGIAAGATLFYVDGAGLTNNPAGYFFGFALETVGAGLTATIKVKHVPSPAAGALGAGTVGVANLAALAAGRVYVGDGAAVNAVAISGDATLAANGALTLDEDVAVRTAKVSLTNAEIKALKATPIELVAAQAGKVLEFVGATLELKAGVNVLAEDGGGSNLRIRYTDGTGVAVSDEIEATGFIDQAANTITRAVPVKDAIVPAADAINKPLVLHNVGAGEIVGNAGNDATLDVFVSYRVLTIAA